MASKLIHIALIIVGLVALAAALAFLGAGYLITNVIRWWIGYCPSHGQIRRVTAHRRVDPDPVAEPDPIIEVKPVDLHSLTVAQLRSMAKGTQIPAWWNMRKADLIQSLTLSEFSC